MSIGKKCVILLAVIVGIVVLSFFAFALLCIFSDLGYLENYSGWKKATVPTDTELQATVKIPKEWEFVIENDIIKIVDADGKTIATEIYSEWRSYGSTLDESKVKFNPELDKEYHNLDNYNFVSGSSSSCTLFEITKGTQRNYAVEMFIMCNDSTESFYYLFLLFDSSIDNITTYEKIQKSFRHGGRIK